MATESKTQSSPSDTNEPEAEPQRPPVGSGVVELARRHPRLAVAGAATLGLLGGIEVAAGIVIGAAVLALVRDGAAPGAATTRRVRHRARELWGHLPQTVRERTRAVVQAARGKPVGQPTPASPPPAE